MQFSASVISLSLSIYTRFILRRLLYKGGANRQIKCTDTDEKISMSADLPQ